MENIIADIATLNKLKKEQATKSEIVETTKPKKITKPTDPFVKPPVIKESKPVVITTTETKPDEIEIVRDKTYSYYVVTISALNEHLAISEAIKIKAKYPKVKIIAQPNGFFRTAIYSGTDKQGAIKLLETVTENGTKQAWVAFY